MANEKEVSAQSVRRSVKEWFRAFSNGYTASGERRPRVGLALAGGFARGIAHIGVLRVFREAGIPIDMVAGTSVGALIGASYCSGASLETMEAIACETKFADFGRWTPSWLGLATNQRMEQFLARFSPIKNFEELRTPLAIAATDINAGLPVYYYQKGPIAPALRASCAYPGLFVPIQYDGRTLVDGFLTALVPYEGLLLMGAEVVIAVYLEPGMNGEPRTFTDVLSRSFTIIQRHADLEWRQYVDVTIEPGVTPVVWGGFTQTPGMVGAGEGPAMGRLPEIRGAIEGEGKKAEE